ncbi:MAG: anthranilate synthase component I family protein [Acidobacteria bacterium]|nr:anthranilate synthase component I family protein [Acidobacteriota bacterium]
MTNFDQFLRDAETANVVPVVETIPADLLTPLSVYLKLADGAVNSFLLESVEGGESLARYSFIGVGPEMVVRGNDKRTVVISETGEVEKAAPLWNYLRTHFADQSVAVRSDLPSFVGGAIGYFGFSCSGWFEPTVRGEIDAGENEAEFMFFRSIVAFDHAKQTIKVISLVFTDEGKGAREMFDKAVERNAGIRKMLEERPIVLPRATAAEGSAQISSNWERPEFENAVRRIKELIAAGECYQVVLSQCFSRPTAASAIAIYRAMRSLNPSPYMFLLKFGERSVIGASPEMLVRCRGGQLEYRPIAGTRKRGDTDAEDARLAEEMRADKKEVAEHQMLVDLGRNDLGRVAEFGSVKVNGLMSVERYSHVQHLVSYLTATLRHGLDRFDAFASCFPAGTVSGAPKVRAIEIIQELEPTPRGIYAGAAGYIDYAGNMDTCIAIRTMVLENSVAKVQAGAGIVADSIPEAEFDETVNKAKALLRAIDIAEGRG